MTSMSPFGQTRWRASHSRSLARLEALADTRFNHCRGKRLNSSLDFTSSIFFVSVSSSSPTLDINDSWRRLSVASQHVYRGICFEPSIVRRTSNRQHSRTKNSRASPISIRISQINHLLILAVVGMALSHTSSIQRATPAVQRLVPSISLNGLPGSLRRM